MNSPLHRVWIISISCDFAHTTRFNKLLENEKIYVQLASGNIFLMLNYIQDKFFKAGINP